MKKTVVVIGIGEIGSVFARGFMRCGYPIYPVTRNVQMSDVEKIVADPELVLITVGESELDGLLSSVPDAWKEKLVLVQNELLPNDWEKHQLNPTVISVWFEKKKGMDSKPIIPSPVFGKHARHVCDALGAIDIPARELEDSQSLLHELVVKNVYILTTNIAGLRVGGNVGELWSKHQDFAREVAGEIIQLQEKLTGQSLNVDELIESMVKAFDGDLTHGCMGRSAPARLARALDLANQHGLELKTLSAISEETK